MKCATALQLFRRRSPKMDDSAQVIKPCIHCHGTGICKVCHGTGELSLQHGMRCTQCFPKGSGWCQNCRGLGGRDGRGRPAAYGRAAAVVAAEVEAKELEAKAAVATASAESIAAQAVEPLTVAAVPEKPPKVKAPPEPAPVAETPPAAPAKRKKAAPAAPVRDVPVRTTPKATAKDVGPGKPAVKPQSAKEVSPPRTQKPAGGGKTGR